MPFPTEFGGRFLGDYSGLTGVDNAYPLWMDTRNPEVLACPQTTPPTARSICTGTTSSGAALNDQDVYTAALSVPSS